MVLALAVRFTRLVGTAASPPTLPIEGSGRVATLHQTPRTHQRPRYLQNDEADSAIVDRNYRQQQGTDEVGPEIQQPMTLPPTPLKPEIREQDQSGAAKGQNLHEDVVHGTKPGRQSGWLGLVTALTVRAVVNPRLALDLIRLLWAFRARGWYRHPPFLPLPPREYTRWRMYTAYGNETAIPPVEDVIRFARWRREVMRL